MTLKSTLLALSFGIFMTAAVSGQKAISIKDPDITFGYTLPQGFENEDDSFYHYIFPNIENGMETASLRLTYFEGFDGELSDFKEGILNGKLYSTLDDFKIKNSGKEIIDGTLRSEEHTSELQSRPHLVCRLLLEKKKNNKIQIKNS